jgi:hypothetical protein
MSRETPRLHDADEDAATIVDPGTSAALTMLKTSYGDQGNAQFSALSDALDKLKEAMVAAINDKSAKLAKLPTNKTWLSETNLKIPSVKPADLNQTIITIVSILDGVFTPDTVKVQRAALLASNVRSPEDLSNFESAKIDQISNQTNQEISELNELLKSVNGLKKQVEST